jgi:hypothetical protein
MKKIIISLTLIIGLSSFGVLHLTTFSETAMWEIPSLLNASRAKEFCSCYFLLGKGHDYCLKRVKHGYPMLGHEVDEEQKMVRFDFLWNSRSATVAKNERLGCKLSID